MKWVDLPPVWLMGALAAAWVAPGRFAPGGLAWLGWGAIALALVLVVLAVMAFRSARTTIIPRESPSALMTTGIFAHSRNPIYLADVLILLGVSLIWGSLLGLVLTPALAVLLQRRFIRGEEALLHGVYPAEFADYVARVRRWF